jgi:3-hydroxyacyl-CoA dehydrogenase
MYKEIDEHVKAGLFPVGIFEFFDHVGIDVMLQSVKNYMSYELDPIYYQPLIDALEAKVKVGDLGKKTKAGFYTYDSNVGKSESKSIEHKNTLLRQIINWYLDGVFHAFSSSFCTKNEIARVVQDYMMIEKNPFDLAEEVGYTTK